MSITIVGASATDNDYPFTTPANYNYNSSLIEVTGGIAQLVNLRPTDATFYASYDTDVNATWGDGDLEGIAVGGASVEGGKLNLTYEDVRYVDYDAVDNADSQQVGAIRFTLTPGYTDNPPTTKVFLSIGKDNVSNNNLMQIQQQNNGNLRFVMYDKDAVLQVLQDTPYGFVEGNEYEIEFNWDLTTGASRIFVDGVQLGATETSTGIRDGDINFLRVGSNGAGSGTSDFQISDFLYFSSVKHTSGYTPGASISNVTYSPDSPTIDPITPVDIITDMDGFIETSTKPANTEIKYQMSSDNGTIWNWYNGSSWEKITSNTKLASTVLVVDGTLDAGNLASLQAIDGDSYNVSEISSTPGYDIRMNFTSVTTPTGINLYSFEDCSVGHTVDMQLWNYSSSAWETIGEIPSDSGFVWNNFSISDGTNFVSGGVTQLRKYFSDQGNVNHHHHIDYIEITQSPLSTNWYYTNEANTASVINTNIQSFDSSGNFTFKAFLNSDSISTPELDNINLVNDDTPPIISNINVTSTTSTAGVTWDTDENSNSSVIYGLSAGNLNLSAGQNNDVTSHSVNLIGLSQATTYFYNLTPCDTYGNCANNGTFNFTTEAPSVATITDITSTSINANIEQIDWITNFNSDTNVTYGLTTALGSEVYDVTPTTTHSINITGLTSNTLYYYNVSSDTGTNVTTNGTFNFTTTSINISNVLASPNTITASITWNTNGLADSKVEYGETIGLGDEVTNSSLVDSHDILLTNLTDGTVYYYKITSCDSGSCDVSATYNFSTSGTLIPINLVVDEYTQTWVKLDWDLTDPVDNSTIQYSTDNSSWSSDSITESTFYTVNGLSNDLEYYFRVKNTEGGYDSDWVYISQRTRRVLSEAQGLIYGFGWLTMLSLFVICLVGAFKINGTNEFDLGGKLLKVNINKYIKLALGYLSYLFLVFTIFLSWQIASNFLIADFLAGILRIFFMVLMYLAFPLFILTVTITIMKWMLDIKLHKLSVRGLPPR